MDFKLYVLAALLAAPTAFANGIFQSVAGDVRSSVAGAPMTAIATNARIVEGTTVATGPTGRATIRLDDGYFVVLAENTEFRLNSYRFDRSAPGNSNIAVELLKGALRSFSGLIGGKNPGRFALATATATIGIRGTDFNVMLVNPVYVSVVEGTVDLTNAAGSFQVGPATSAIVNSAQTLATTIATSALPAQVAATFAQLNSVVLVAGAAGAGAATTAATGTGLGAGTAAALAAAAAAAAALTRDAGTTGTTGTR